MRSSAGRQEQPWWHLESTCLYCGESDFTEEYGDKLFLVCDSCCCVGTHIGCHAKATGKRLQKDFIDSGAEWFCAPVRSCLLGNESSGAIKRRDACRRMLRRALHTPHKWRSTDESIFHLL